MQKKDKDMYDNRKQMKTRPGRSVPRRLTGLLAWILAFSGSGLFGMILPVRGVSSEDMRGVPLKAERGESAQESQELPAAACAYAPVGIEGDQAEDLDRSCAVRLYRGGVEVTAHRPASEVRQVYVGGMPFGIQFVTEGVTVVGFCDVTSGDQNPARLAGLQLKDRITHVNDAALDSAEALTRAVDASEGRPIKLTVHRMVRKRTAGGSVLQQMEFQATVTPQYSEQDGQYRTGVWVRDSGAGIGTVTYIIPDTEVFGGLGHGVCDGDTGELIPMQSGTVRQVTISGVDRGEAGDPGALKGFFHPGKIGTLLDNTECGVFGVLTSIPAGCGDPNAFPLVSVASPKEVREGEALVRCTLDDGSVGEYSVMLSDVDRSADGSRCFTVTVTDPALLKKTGGIVQGMSGSPILQNGKLVGAMTHVLINDPASGYGIFVQNMLNHMPVASSED